MADKITRANVEALLDGGKIEAAMSNGRWWEIRRNGATKRWKKDPSRIRIPFKAGLRVTSQITESDFRPDGTLRPDWFRVKA